jgi:GTP-binding protein
MAGHLFKQSNERVGTGRLNAAIKQIFEERIPSTPRGQRAKILYATQVDVAPPSIVLFVNNPTLFDANYQRFVLNRFREMLPFTQVPMRLMIRGRENRSEADPEAPATAKRPRPRSRSRKR